MSDDKSVRFSVPGGPIMHNTQPAMPAHASAAKLVLIVSSALTYWLLMMPIHELGHVFHALATGGRVVRVVLHPPAFSRTDISPNPFPLAVVCGGPIWGSILPVLLWLAWRSTRLPGAKWWQGLAGFCMIANGLYIASGIAIPAGDTEDLLRLGVPVWALVGTGMPAIAIGFWIIHRMGRHFGIADSVPRSATKYACLAVAGFVTIVLILLTIAGGTSITPAAAPPAASPSS